ncbi:hypothetical protein L798_11304 [Zootermopsis nevadensis]|uniref:Uncharacterized protein n=1 Tax=Zootermopsis nevadensis TaxID=136037 RepID=A0A067QWM8_ZOONE|nr:hypothetical protein L798_11304 [Zootermopsis nevadensis]
MSIESFSPHWIVKSRAVMNMETNLLEFHCDHERQRHLIYYACTQIVGPLEFNKILPHFIHSHHDKNCNMLAWQRWIPSERIYHHSYRPLLLSKWRPIPTTNLKILVARLVT